MKIDINIQQIIGAVFTAILILFFYSKSSLDKELYYKTINQLNQIKEHKNKLFGDVFLTRYNQIKHYDVVQEDIHHIFKLSTQLTERMIKTTNELKDKWTLYLQQIEDINENLNNFMSHNAILRSFIGHYPQLSNELYGVVESLNNELSIEILNIQNYILVLHTQNRLANKEIIIGMLNRVANLSKTLPKKEEKLLDHFILYTNDIIFYSEKMKILEDQFIRSGINKEINSLIGDYNNYYKKLEKNSNGYLLAMVVLSLGLLGWIIVFIQHLKTANNQIQKTINKLEISNNQLFLSNTDLKKSIENLAETQDQLILSEKMASLGDLVAGITHEVNTPIGLGVTATTHLEVLTKEINTLFQSENISKEELDEYLQESLELTSSIHTNLAKAANLMRSFKQVAVDQSSEEKRVFNVKGYLEEIFRNLKHKTKRKNFKFIVECDDKIELRSYPGPFSQVITNLIMNSMIHGFKDIENAIINIRIKEEDNKLILFYKDNGKGIKEEHIEKIYDPFFTTNRDKGGSGLGLNIIYNIVVIKLNGTIDCSSKEGEGVLFEIVIPS